MPYDEFGETGAPDWVNGLRGKRPYPTSNPGYGRRDANMGMSDSSARDDYGAPSWMRGGRSDTGGNPSPTPPEQQGPPSLGNSDGPPGGLSGSTGSLFGPNTSGSGMKSPGDYGRMDDLRGQRPGNGMDRANPPAWLGGQGDPNEQLGSWPMQPRPAGNAGGFDYGSPWGKPGAMPSQPTWRQVSGPRSIPPDMVFSQDMVRLPTGEMVDRGGAYRMGWEMTDSGREGPFPSFGSQPSPGYGNQPGGPPPSNMRVIPPEQRMGQQERQPPWLVAPNPYQPPGPQQPPQQTGYWGGMNQGAEPPTREGPFRSFGPQPPPTSPGGPGGPTVPPSNMRPAPPPGYGNQPGEPPPSNMRYIPPEQRGQQGGLPPRSSRPEQLLSQPAGPNQNRMVQPPPMPFVLRQAGTGGTIPEWGTVPKAPPYYNKAQWTNMTPSEKQQVQGLFQRQYGDRAPYVWQDWVQQMQRSWPNLQALPRQTRMRYG